jgi:hypothetical protein
MKWNTQFLIFFMKWSQGLTHFNRRGNSQREPDDSLYPYTERLTGIACRRA